MTSTPSKRNASEANFDEPIAKLSKNEFELTDVAKLNPHTLQNKSCYYYEGNFDEKCRFIHENTKHEKYQRRAGKDKSTIHFGQRKLLLSEIEFLTIVTKELYEMNIDKKIIFIYAGAAPGQHIPFLINMFPYIEKFILVDPAKFKFDDSQIKGKYESINKYFTNEMASELNKKYDKDEFEILLVSDIRTADHRKLNKEETESRVEEDMKYQLEWYKILNPFKSMFKFRLPYVGDDELAKTQFEYLDGKAYFQTWEGKTSSETRLIVNKDAKMKLYDCVKYEDMLFRFNTVERVICYKHDIEAPGIDHCYDCRAEIFILEEYLKHKSKVPELYKRIYNTDLVETSFCKISNATDFVKEINKELNADRRTDALKITWNGKQNLYSVPFTDLYYGVDLDNLFHEDKIVRRRFIYNSSDDENDDNDDLVKTAKETCKSIHTLEAKTNEYENVEDFGRMRELTDEFREKVKPKERYQFTDKTTVYFKERSLRLSEIEFLTQVSNELINHAKYKSNKKIVCIYAGASASKSIESLHEMFPFIKFILYDPVKMNSITSPMIEIYQENLTEQLALDLKNEYKNHVRLFISNIKRADSYVNEINIKLEKEDINLQMQLYTILEPFKSMLKFRIPFPESKLNTKVNFDYLDGKILFKPWSHNLYLEANLMVDEKASRKSYSYFKFKNQLHRFNTVERVRCYKHNVCAKGIDHCYDCKCEVFIFEEYVKQRDFIYNHYCSKKLIDERISKKVEDYIGDLNDILEAGRKFVQIEFDKIKYRIRFTDIQYGKYFDEIIAKNTLIDNNEEKNFLFNLIKKQELKIHEKEQIKEYYSKYYKPMNNQKKYPIKEINDVLITRNRYGTACFRFIFKNSVELNIGPKYLLEETDSNQKNKNFNVNYQGQNSDLLKRLDFSKKNY